MTTAQEQLDMDDLVACAVDALADGKITFGELVSLGGKLAGKVSQLSRLSGKEKEQLVLKVVEVALQQVLKEKKKALSAEEFSAFFDKTEAAKEFVHETLPAVLEVVVQASKGKLDFGKATKTGWTVARYLCSCWGVRLPEEPKIASVPSPEVETKAPEIPLPPSPKVEVVEEEKKEPESSVVRQETMPQLPNQPDEETKPEDVQPTVVEQVQPPQEEVKTQE